MITLLINNTSSANLLTETSFGGLPVKDKADFAWPKCESCESDMQYQGKIKTDIGLELIFLCNNDKDCDQWDAEAGANKVIIVSGEELEFFKPNDVRLSLREIEYGSTLVEVDAESYETARGNWAGNRREVLGQLYGTPGWLQADDTPKCNCCNKPMRFVAQLEEGPDHKTAMNFGGGVAYLFDCIEGKTAKFLWQC